MTGDNLHYLAADDITAEILQELVVLEMPEGFTLEYKRQLGNGAKVLEAVAEMANAWGGLILVGIDEHDQSGQHGLAEVGVRRGLVDDVGAVGAVGAAGQDRHVAYLQGQVGVESGCGQAVLKVVGEAVEEVLAGWHVRIIDPAC